MLDKSSAYRLTNVVITVIYRYKTLNASEERPSEGVCDSGTGNFV